MCYECEWINSKNGKRIDVHMRDNLTEAIHRVSIPLIDTSQVPKIMKGAPVQPNHGEPNLQTLIVEEDKWKYFVTYENMANNTVASMEKIGRAHV